MPKQKYRQPGIKPLHNSRYQARVFHHGFEESRTFHGFEDAKRWQRNLKKELERAPAGIERSRGQWVASVITPDGVVSKQFETLDKATEWFSSSSSTLAAGGTLPSEVPSPTLSEVVAEWRPKHPSAGKKAFATYNSQLRRHILPHLGDSRIDLIAKTQIEDWVVGLTRAGLGVTTTIASYKLLHQILEFAVDRGYLKANPGRKVRLPSRKKAPKTALTKPQLLLLAEECGDYKHLVIFLGLTGLRIGEAIALDCGDVDFERNVILVNKSMATDENGRLLDPAAPTKTGEFRSVPLASFLQDDLAQATRGREKAEPLFVGQGGGRLNYGWFRRAVFVPAAKRAGLERVSIHTLRHTCASLLIQMGTPVTTVSHILGHASVKMTLDVYSHFYEQDTEVWVNRLSSSLSEE
jgi:integrase